MEWGYDVEVYRVRGVLWECCAMHDVRGEMFVF